MSPSAAPSPPPRPTLSRPTIVAAALRLVSESGLDALSLRRLASDLGVTAPALYAHVRDKSDLLAAMAESGFRRLIERYAEITTDDPIERITCQCRIYVDLALAEPGLFAAMFLFRPGVLDGPGATDELPAASEAFEPPSRAIAEAIERGSIHASHDPFVTALTMWTVSHGLAQVLLLGVPPDEDGRRRLEDAVLGTTLRGLRTPAD